MALGSTEAIQKKHHHHMEFAPFHGQVAAEHDMLLALQGDDKPPPDQQGGLVDDRYTAHWRKPWPQGIDNSVNDEDVLNLKGKKRTAKDKPEVFTYPWTLDSDIVDSQKHLDDVQGELEHEMDKVVYQDRGYKVLNRGYKAIKSWYL